jgi:hypothetical protein
MWTVMPRMSFSAISSSPCVNAGAHVESKGSHGLTDRQRAADCGRWSIEGRQEPIACRDVPRMYPGLKSRRGKCTAWSIRPNVSTHPAHPGREAQRAAYSFRGMSLSIESDRLTGLGYKAM